MNVALRNLLAAWCLDALAAREAEPRVEALAAFARAADASGVAVVSEEHCRALAESPFFERTTAGGLRLQSDVARDVGAVRERAARFVVALAAARAACGIADHSPPSLDWTLRAAAALFNARLFFEVHELLEGAWKPAGGSLRTFLQGLIQIAVGFHHLENDNSRGAVSLLAEGFAKLQRFGPEAYGVELAEFCAATERIRERLAAAASSDVEPPRLSVRQSPSDRTR